MDALPHEKRRMVEALSILHDFTAQFIHRKVSISWGSPPGGDFPPHVVEDQHNT
jgi:hypothetical protein